MSNFLSLFTKSLTSGSSEIPETFSLSLAQNDFTKSDILATYTKILTDTVERTYGIKKEYEPLLWDNYVQSESNEGLISLLVTAMASSSDLFIVFVKSVKVLRKATREEETQIKEDYKKTGESKVGVFISFRGYRRTEMLLIYSALEYCVLCSLHKNVNLSKAIQFKMNDLRAGVSLSDSAVAVEQAKSIAQALGRGNDVFLDVKDNITTATPDISSTEKAISFLDAKRAFILGLPLAYISGIQTGGIGSTGEADMRAVERGLKQYFVSIIEPVLNAVFGIDVEFKSQDFRQVTSALEALKTFDLVSDDNLSRQSKQEILARMFEVDPDEETKALAKEAKERDTPTPQGVPIEK